MGWWKVRETENVVGDEVFSALRNAALAVAATYQHEFDRSPTIAEWEILFEHAIQPLEDLESSRKEYLIAGQMLRPTSVKISLEDSTE
jgi:hypothetical protein